MNVWIVNPSKKLLDSEMLGSTVHKASLGYIGIEGDIFWSVLDLEVVVDKAGGLESLARISLALNSVSYSYLGKEIH